MLDGYSEFTAVWRRSLWFALKGLLVAFAGAAVSIIAMLPGLTLLGLVGFPMVGVGVAMGFVGVLRPFVWLVFQLLRTK